MYRKVLALFILIQVSEQVTDLITHGEIQIIPSTVMVYDKSNLMTRRLPN
jgi:hypothetical protein